MMSDSTTQKPTVGIDLGTTNTSLAIWKNGEAVVLKNKAGKSTTPSCVSITPNGSFVGESAIYQSIVYPQNTIFDAKRLIGRSYQTAKILAKYWPFNLINDGNNIPQYEVEYQNEKKKIYPEQISAIVLKKVKDEAESQLENRIENVVITVPAYFNENQRESTKIAAEIAGLNVLKIISEPAAAVLAFGSTIKVSAERNVLVYDIGGGTFDTAVVSINELGMYEVRSTNGDTTIGGANFDNRLVDYCISHLKGDALDLTDDQVANRRLRLACEKAKKDLSKVEQTRIMVDWIENEAYEVPITRQIYDQLIGDYITRTMDCVKLCIKDAGLTREQIDDIVLVGGSTHNVIVKETLQTFFEKDVNTSIDSLESVAIGAAIQAATLEQRKDAPRILLNNVTPLSIGILSNQKVRTVIKRNTAFPMEVSYIGRTSEDNQTEMAIDIFEGEQNEPIRSNYLGRMILTGLEMAPKRKIFADIILTINRKGELSVKATDKKKETNSVKITIVRPKQFSEDAIIEMRSFIQNFFQTEKECPRDKNQGLIPCLIPYKRTKLDERLTDVEFFEKLLDDENEVNLYANQEDDVDLSSDLLIGN